MTARTGWAMDLCQDECRGLSKWFASRIDARQVVRMVCAEIKEKRMTDELEPPQRCPVCDGEWHAEDCELGNEVARRLKAEAERDKLRAEVERLRPNAERYEWLRDNHESEWAICEWQDDPDGLGYYRDARASHIVDAAIDHARTHKDTL